MTVFFATRFHGQGPFSIPRTIFNNFESLDLILGLGDVGVQYKWEIQDEFAPDRDLKPPQSANAY